MISLAKYPEESAASAAQFLDADKTYKRITRRLIPLLFILYLMSNIDRVNVSIAQLQMKSDLGFTDAVYGLGASLFFVSYALFELPNTYMVTRLGALKTIMLLTVGWGCVSSLTMFVRTPISFYTLRFLLGVFEAGFTPIVVYYLSRWYPLERRSKPLALFSSGIVISGILAYPLSGVILKFMHDVGGLSGWQWMFPLEGLPCVVLGLLVPVLLDESPQTANWLSPNEKTMIASMLEAGAPAKEGQTFAQTLRNPRLYALMAVYFFFASAIAVLHFWLPTIIRSLGVTDIALIGLYSAIPSVVSLVAMITIGAHADRTRRLRENIVTLTLVGGAALCLLPLVPNSLVLSLVLLSVAGAALFTFIPLFWASVPACLPGPGVANAIAAVATIGLLGGVVSPASIGWLKTHTGSMSVGIYIFGALFAAGGLLYARTTRNVANLRKREI
ncbi:MFS transporter [Paraburkholderia sp. MM5384-R2]|uniref:MFS transporter n=1 Tax=Paraburkholderia sp. MM5384-R2 TaxID=2723097 RepID=UPI0016214899|nr:MFS transporter [Paraburkholderia sp. MM5384-R2]MBB5497554.1 MFS family permease [Paraburkholderia sp. MM5384-R2]